MVKVFLAKALLCVQGQCFPVLVGENTPTGTFQIEHVVLNNRRGRYDVLMFAPDKPGKVLAIHRTPSESRTALLKARSRAPVTAGCINVSPAVFELLVECCSTATLEIQAF